MTKIQTTLHSLIALSLATLIFGFSEASQTKEQYSSAETSPTRENLYWYDGKKVRKLNVDPNRWAEFGADANNQSNQNSVKANMLDNNLSGKKVRIYKHSRSRDASRSSIELAAKSNPATRYSEVFMGGGGVRALPGGILVSFHKDYDFQKIEEWASQKGLNLQKQVLKKNNIWLIDTPSGIQSLTIANQIAEQGEVRTASPNWWIPMSIK